MSTLHGWLLLVRHKYPEMTMLLAYINNILFNTHATMGYGIWNQAIATNSTTITQNASISIFVIYLRDSNASSKE